MAQGDALRTYSDYEHREDELTQAQLAKASSISHALMFPPELAVFSSG